MSGQPSGPKRRRIPRYGDRFVGRRDDLAFLQSTHEHVQVVGLTGVGKSRLIARCAREVRRRGATVGWCDATTCTTADQLARQLAADLGRTLPPSLPPGEAILDSLQVDLLILDGADHLDAGARAWLPRLLASVPRAWITARALLTAGPAVHTLSPLDSADARELFVLRTPGLPFDGRAPEDHPELLDTLLHHIGGLPLAIELTASRLEVLPLHSLVASVARSGAVVEGPADQAPLRRALRATFASLSVLGRQILVHAAAFRGGPPLDAIQDHHDHPLPDLIDALHGLLRRGLVRPDPNTTTGLPPRYLVPPVVHDFLASKVHPDLTVAHARWYAGCAERWFQQRNAPEHGPTAHKRLAIEWANLRRVLDLAPTSPAHQLLAARCMVGAWLVAFHHHSPRELHDTLDVLVETPDLPPAVRAELLLNQAYLRQLHDTPQHALAAVERAICDAEAAGTHVTIGNARGMQARLHHGMGYRAAARAALAQQRALAVELDHPRMERHGPTPHGRAATRRPHLHQRAQPDLCPLRAVRRPHLPEAGPPRAGRCPARRWTAWRGSALGHGRSGLGPRGRTRLVVRLRRASAGPHPPSSGLPR